MSSLGAQSCPCMGSAHPGSAIQHLILPSCTELFYRGLITRFLTASAPSHLPPHKASSILMFTFTHQTTEPWQWCSLSSSYKRLRWLHYNSHHVSQSTWKAEPAHWQHNSWMTYTYCTCVELTFLEKLVDSLETFIVPTGIQKTPWKQLLLCFTNKGTQWFKRWYSGMWFLFRAPSKALC